ncbi:MAG: hypothetical protein EPN97_10910 [Alphaproteobacteria bacterium]|nr:MAG: hypothetical protein EPN97_10910 [Alphaproteobacteria bacterium]
MRKVYLTSLIALFALTVLFLGIPRAYAEDDKHAACPYRGDTSNAIFQHLKGIGLFVDVPLDYTKVIACHEHEEECWEKENRRGISREDYLKNLKESYNSYPKALMSDALESLFSKEALLAWSSYLKPDVNCNYSAPISLGNSHEPKPLPEGLKLEDVLILHVKVQIEEDTTPRIAVVSTAYYRLNYYRPNKGPYAQEAFKVCSNRIDSSGVKAFPLDMPANKMEQLVKGFARQAIGGPPIPRQP